MHKGINPTSSVAANPAAVRALRESQDLLENLEDGYNHLAPTKSEMKRLIDKDGSAANFAITPSTYVHTGEYIIEVNRRLQSAKRRAEKAGIASNATGEEIKILVAEEVKNALGVIRNVLQEGKKLS